MYKVLIFAFVVSVLVNSCNSARSNSQEVVFKTDAQLTNCVDGSQGVALGKNCFNAYKEPSNEKYNFGINTIKGFQFVEGFKYTLNVQETRLDNPPPDGWAYSYTLVKVADKVATP